MNDIVIIPARHCSSRLPGKCMADVGGRPALSWAVDIARDGDDSRRVIVLSEHDGTLEYAESLGCETVREPMKLAASDIFETEMAEYVLGKISGKPEICIVVYGNTVIAPPRIVERVADAVRCGADYAQTAIRVPTMFHPWRAIDVNFDEFITGTTERWSQDYPPLYVVSSAAMAFRADVLPKLNGRTLRQMGDEITRTLVIHDPLPLGDIDTAEDLEAARGALCEA